MAKMVSRVGCGSINMMVANRMVNQLPSAVATYPKYVCCITLPFLISPYIHAHNGSYTGVIGLIKSLFRVPYVPMSYP